MKLSAMRYKGYVWPHNPGRYEIGFQRDVASRAVPFGEYTLQQMGRRHRILRGSGAFVGENAYAEFKKLASVFYDPTPGLLIHPLWDAAMAYFVALELEQEPTENYVAYRFEFWECSEGVRTALEPLRSAADAPAGTAARTEDGGERYYEAVWGDCCLGIAAANGLTLEALLALNPQIKNPNLLYAGERLRVR